MNFTPQVPVALTVTMTPEGQIQVSGPLENKLLCYGLLEFARDAIQKFEQTPRSIIEAARGPLPPL